MTDVVVIGGGPNGLVAAARLARAGRDVTVLERRAVLGGLAAGEEFHPGYRHAGVHQDTAVLSPLVEAGLDLKAHGLRRESRSGVRLMAEGGDRLVLSSDAAETVAALESVSPRDAERYAGWRRKLERFGRVLRPLWSEAPPDALHPTLPTLMKMGRSALTLRRLGKDDMLDLIRVAPMCVADWLNEWFEDERLKAGLAIPGISGTWLGPWSGGSNLNLILREVQAAGGEVVGGGAALARALEAAARAGGASLRTEAQVESVRVEGGAVRAVELTGGELVEARTVLSTCDPHSTLRCLVHPRELPQRAAHRVEHFRARGTTAVVHLALTSPLQLPRGVEPCGRARIGATLDDLERAFDGVKYGELPRSPVLEVEEPFGVDAPLAPGAGGVVSLLVHFVPHDLAGGWTDERRHELGELAIDTLDRHVVGLRDTLVAREVLSPVDLAERYGTTGGHIHHGEHALDQLLLRPTPETARYATPIEGLFLGGSGSHPGGGLTGLPGWLSAGEVLSRY